MSPSFYEALMATADERCVWIGLTVGELVGPKGVQHRTLAALTAKRGDAIRSEPILNDDIEGAARRLLPKLP